MKRSVGSLRIGIVLIFVCAAIFSGLWLLVPLPANIITNYAPYGTVITLFDMVIAVSGAGLFLLALRNFRAELRPAYRFIAFAELSISLAAMLAPFTVFYDLWNNPVFYVLAYMGYFTASILMFLGTRKFAQILGMQSRVTSIKLIIGLGLAAWGLHALLPHAAVADLHVPETSYDIFELIPTLPLFTYGAALYLAIRLGRKIGLGYKKAFRWLIIGLSVQLTAALLTALLELIGYNNWIFNTGLYALPIIVGDASLVIAAYQFNAIGLPYQKIVWLQKLFGKGKTSEASSVDIILQVAGLVSDPSKIDAKLDTLREITAQLPSGQAVSLSREQELVLRDLYLDIEQYLMHDDRLRFFSQSELRNSIWSSFSSKNMSIEHTFWPLLGPAV